MPAVGTIQVSVVRGGGFLIGVLATASFCVGRHSRAAVIEIVSQPTMWLTCGVCANGCEMGVCVCVSGLNLFSIKQRKSICDRSNCLHAGLPS